jgi:hypothetical protein
MRIRQNFKGLLIRVAAINAKVVRKMGAKQPPTKNNVIDRLRKITEPYFLSYRR